MLKFGRWSFKEMKWHIHTARYQEWDWEQWVTIYYTELFTLYWDQAQDQTHCLLLYQTHSLFLSRFCFPCSVNVP